MKKVDGPAVRLADATDAALAGVPGELAVTLVDVAAACGEGLMAVAVEAGLATALAIMNDEAVRLCGPWNARDAERACERGGTTATSVVMGGQRLPLRRPRVHQVVDGRRGGDVPLETFGVFAQGDLLTATVLERMLAGVATRSFERAADPSGAEQRGAARPTSKGAVPRRFVSGTKAALDALLSRDLQGLAPLVLMIDGTDFGGATCVVALIVTGDGTKVPVGLRVADTENKTVVTALLADLVARGLDTSGGLLVVIDGAKALAAAVTAVFGEHAVVQRCVLHKRRNVADHLPKRDRESVDARLRGAFADPDPAAGLRKARLLAAELDKTWPDAAGSLREGLADMFSVRRLGIDGTLARTLTCTNMIESMISIATTTCRNVKHWQDKGDMRRRWCAAALLEPDRQSRRARGHRQPPQLAAALQRHPPPASPPCHTDNNEQVA